jgi:hypothetical protein
MACEKTKETEETDAISNLAFVASRLCVPTSICTCVSTILKPSVSSRLQSLLVGFDGVKNDKLPRVFHEIIAEDKGKEFSLGGFKSPPINVKRVEVNPLHVIFDLKGVFVGKEYFKINHLLPSSFNLARGHTLLGKKVVPRLSLKEFILMCLEQFIVYIWTFTPLAKVNAYLRKIAKETSIKIDPQRIIG